MKIKITFSLLLLMAYNKIIANDTLKVIFVYGSKPRVNTEQKWFGGIHGGHVSIQYKDAFASFVHKGSLHLIPQKKLHSKFIRECKDSFLHDTTHSKYLIVEIPITNIQKKAIDSIITQRFKNPSYDYAFLGYRCASSAYEILSSAKVFKHKSQIGIKLKYFYPKLLRKKILKEAKKNKWRTILRNGRTTRKWEKD